MNPRSAAMRLNDYERTQATLLAEEAIDDPRMAPVLLTEKAIAGEVTVVTRIAAKSNNCFCRRPSTLRTQEPCVMPGTEVWWTQPRRGGNGSWRR